jgi:hypothetical protein
MHLLPAVKRGEGEKTQLALRFDAVDAAREMRLET